MRLRRRLATAGWWALAQRSRQRQRCLWRFLSRRLLCRFLRRPLSMLPLPRRPVWRRPCFLTRPLSMQSVMRHPTLTTRLATFRKVVQCQVVKQVVKRSRWSKGMVKQVTNGSLQLSSLARRQIASVQQIPSRFRPGRLAQARLCLDERPGPAGRGRRLPQLLWTLIWWRNSPAVNCVQKVRSRLRAWARTRSIPSTVTHFKGTIPYRWRQSSLTRLGLGRAPDGQIGPGVHQPRPTRPWRLQARPRPRPRLHLPQMPMLCFLLPMSRCAVFVPRS